MCYHISTPDPAKLAKELTKYTINYVFKPYYHVSAFSRPVLPVTTNANVGSVEPAQWKLLPFWVKNEEQADKYSNTYNAPSEYVFEKGSYKYYIGKYRGLLWVDGFYEPHKNKNGEIENYYIYLPLKRVFSIGIVIAPWMNSETGVIINTFSILTTQVNELLAEVNNEKKRMPLIISPNDRDAWLGSNGKKEIQSFFTPFNGLLEAHKVYKVTEDGTGNTNRPDIQNFLE